MIYMGSWLSWESAAFAMRRSSVRVKATEVSQQQTLFLQIISDEIFARYLYGPIAQLGERRVRNAEVMSSS